jgi:PAS domain S-box-containing protein
VEIQTAPIEFRERSLIFLTVRDIAREDLIEFELKESRRRLQEREKELECAYEISRLVETMGIEWDDLLQRIVNLVPSACRTPERTSARIVIHGNEYFSPNYTRAAGSLVSEITVRGDSCGSVEVNLPVEDVEPEDGTARLGKRTLLHFISGRLGRAVEKRTVDRDLRESEEKFRHAFEYAGAGIALLDTHGRFLRVNGALCDIFGYSEPELLDLSLDKITDPGERQVGRALILRLLQGRTDYFAHERKCVHKDGRVLWALVGMSAVRDVDGVIEYLILQLQDSTERRVAETALKQSEERYRIIADFNYDWELWIGVDLRLIYVSPSSGRITGYTADEFYADPQLLIGIVHPDDREQFAHHLDCAADLMDDAETSFDFRIIRKDGEERWLHHVCRAVFAQDGVRLGRRVSHRDVTDRKRMEQELRAEEEKFRAIFENAGDSIFLKDTDLKFTRVNPSMRELLGLSESEILGKDAEDIFGAEAGREIRNGDMRVLTGHSVEKIHARQVKGLAMTFHEITVPLRDSHGVVFGLCGVSRNITELTKANMPRPSFVEEYPSKAMQETLRQARMAAVSDAIVLLTGESGCGKDHLARWIHEHSRRSGGPYFVLNCAALSQELAESELFGHEAGAFTGARTRKKGLIELAESGTLVLNEIGELPLMIQSKLLTFLDGRTFVRVGGVKSVQVDVRLIAATHRNLEKEIAEGRFLEPLFYRLNVFPIDVPPLRDRHEDIPVIVQEILSRLATEMHLEKVPRLDANAIEALTKYHWPGNVRELRNVVERALIVAGLGSVTLSVPQLSKHSEEWKYSVDFSTSKSLPEIKDDLTKSFCVEALKRCRGNRVRASRLLGISRDSLYRYIDQFKLEAAPRRPAR